MESRDRLDGLRRLFVEKPFSYKRRMAEVDSQQNEEQRVRRWVTRELAARVGVRVPSFRPLLAEMLADGVLVRHGKRKEYFGRAADIDRWLMGQWNGGES